LPAKAEFGDAGGLTPRENILGILGTGIKNSVELAKSGFIFWHNRQKVWVEVISLLFDFDKTVKIVL